MKERIIELLNSINNDDILLGLILAVQEDIWDEIAIYVKEGLSINHSLYNIRGSYDFEIVILKGQFFEMYSDTIWKLNMDNIEYINEGISRGSIKILYTDNSIQ